ncbi:MAG TPA: alpha/beta fold hydrolase [Pirellulales bacterium]|nr:alpha/beta fold hydrolase [Pirellulales bacterium]
MTVHRWQTLFPFPPRYFQVGAARLHYVDQGPATLAAASGQPAARETLLLVHGNPTWSFHWRKLIGAFEDRYRLIAPDHIGCGGSDKPRDYPYTLAQHVANLCALIEHLQLRDITLIAQDWGGAIGMGAAVALPSRFRRFILGNTAAFRSNQMPWRIAACRLPGVGRLAVQGMNLFLRAALRMALQHPDRLTKAERAGYLAPYDNWPHRQAIYRFVEDIPLRASHPSYSKLLEIETGLRQFRDSPVQLFWGMRDWCFTPHFLERFVEFFPAGEVHRFADAGHWVFEEAHQEIAERIGAFLRNHPLASKPAEMFTRP